MRVDGELLEQGEFVSSRGARKNADAFVSVHRNRQRVAFIDDFNSEIPQNSDLDFENQDSFLPKLWQPSLQELLDIKAHAASEEFDVSESVSYSSEHDKSFDFVLDEKIGAEPKIVYEQDGVFFELSSAKTEKEKREIIKDRLRAERIAIAMEKKAVKLRKKKEKKSKKVQNDAERIRHPIGVKLIAIICAIVVFSLGCVTYLVSYFVTQDVRFSAEENNLAINGRTASDTENRINGTVQSVGMFLDMLRTPALTVSELDSLESMFFSRNPSIVAVYVPKSDRLYCGDMFFIAHEIDKKSVRQYFKQESEMSELARNGSFEMLNASPFFSVPTIALFCQLMNGIQEESVCILYSTEEIGESFSSGNINQSFFVNNDGEVLVHSDINLMLSGYDESENPIVQAMSQSQLNNGQLSFFNERGEEFIGAFKKLRLGNGAVLTVVKTSVVLEGVRATTRRNLYITGMILALAVIIIYFFAKRISVPLRQLTEITNEINRGNFNTELFGELKVKSKDEIGVLANSTKNEREILNTVSRLTNKVVTKAIITKQIDFNPHLKDITIFFSDIRRFTEISDGFKNRFGEQSAAQIINFLNDYMSRMVTCIKRTGGIVDKFEGDAIMAVWGVLRNDDLKWEIMKETSVTRALKKDAHDRYVKEDALNAITCCVAMRYSLMKYNKDAHEFTLAHRNDALAEYKPKIQIGAGLNSGRVTVGFMGSFDKMEFTSIGDAVNFASRTESSNKPCGTDILITEDTYNILKNDYIRCEENNFTIRQENLEHEVVVERIPVSFDVKGKGKQYFYGVVNMPNFDIQNFFSETDALFKVDPDCEKAVGPNGPKSLSELRILLGIPEPDFGKVNLNAEENKVQVASP